MAARLTETWRIAKPAVVSDKGLVASHHREASEIGAGVLAAGGNAVDAAVAAGLAIGVLEPWMSGLGGCGYMVVRDAGAGRCHAVDFGVVASKALDPVDYPLAAGAGADDDLFGWPRVVGDRNVQGPLSIAAPTAVAGLSAALERFGALSWAEAIGPAVAMAKRGMTVDWYATLRIALEARGLADDPASRDFFMPGGLPAASPDAGNPMTLRSDAQVATLERLRDAGPDDFYRGDLAATVAADMARAGARVSADDLAACEGADRRGHRRGLPGRDRPRRAGAQRRSDPDRRPRPARGRLDGGGRSAGRGRLRGLWLRPVRGLGAPAGDDGRERRRKLHHAHHGGRRQGATWRR